ncbi:unnamed protein product [Rhizophagus irregularis]|nr:unnamed protein product [Rhizophagus irregularis]
MKSSLQASAIPFKNDVGQSIQNPEGIDFGNIISQLDLKYMKDLNITYQEQKKSYINLFGLSENHEERTERLLIHSYDIRIAKRKKDRSMQNTKLIDLLEGSLHSTEDYVSVIRLIINIPELCAYLEENVLIAPMDYPGQKNIRRAVRNYLIKGEQSSVPRQILNIVPFIGPLHVSLNSRETVFLINYDFFEKMYHAVFGPRKILAKKPKPYRINLLLELVFKGWLLVKESVKNLFYNCKDPEACTFINLLDDVIPLVLDFYPIIFRSGCWEVYKEVMILQYDIKQIVSFNTAQQIINQAKLIDQMRGENSFIEVFSKNHNIVYTEKQLDFLEKKTAIFLIEFFQNIWKNRGRVTKQKVKKHWRYNLPTLNKIVDKKILPMGWNSSYPPKLDKLCDWNKCDLSSEAPGSILSCGHGYHIECFEKLHEKCPHCYKYLCDGIRHNCKIFQNTLDMEFDNIEEDSNEDLEEQTNLQESNVDEAVSMDEDINNKLVEVLKSLKLYQ